MDALHQQQASYDVGGVRYPRPFKIRRLGHFGFNVADIDGGIDFYSRLLGFRITDIRDLKKIPGREEIARKVDDGRIVFMSHNSDHHAFRVQTHVQAASLLYSNMPNQVKSGAQADSSRLATSWSGAVKNGVWPVAS